MARLIRPELSNPRADEHVGIAVLAAKAEALAGSDRQTGRAAELFKEDPQLARHLREAGGDVALAASLARSELVQLEAKRRVEAAYSRGPLNALGKRLVAPALLIALTAILGNWVASSLQEAAFVRNRSFEHKLALLQQAEARATDWLQDSTRAYYDILSDEDARKETHGAATMSDADRAEFSRVTARHIERIQAQIDSLDKMSGTNRIIDALTRTQEPVAIAEERARVELLASVECLQKKAAWNTVCAGGFRLAPLNEYRASFATATIQLLDGR